MLEPDISTILERRNAIHSVNNCWFSAKTTEVLSLRRIKRVRWRMFVRDSLMADSASDSYFHSDVSRLRHISSSLFSVPGFFVGVSTKVSPISDSNRSPKSPLDFGVFSNIRYSVSLPPARLLTQSGRERKWHCNKLGLGIFTSLDNDTPIEVLDLPKRKNIVFGPQVKTRISNSSRSDYYPLDYSLKSKSLPRNYIVSQHYRTKNLNPLLRSENDNTVNEGGLPFESEQFGKVPLSFSDSTGPSLLVGFKNCTQATSAGTPHSVTDTGLEVENSLSTQPYSLPIPICSDQGNTGAISPREIELSEDYTCIISHGPNPKTIHIFGDCVLECQTNNLNSFVKKEVPGTKSPQVVSKQEKFIPGHSDKVLKFCYFCNKKFEDGEAMYTYRDEKAFCSLGCRLKEIFSEEGREEAFKHSSCSSPESSYHEDIFLLGMPGAI